MTLGLVSAEQVGVREELREYQPETLGKRFVKRGFLGGGGEGCVYQVLDQENGKVRALKISSDNQMIYPRAHVIKRVVTDVLDSGASPHVTRIHILLAVKVPFFIQLATEEEGLFFIRRQSGEGSGTFPRQACLMERLEGDVETLYGKSKLPREVLIALKVQVISIQFILKSRGVFPGESHKWRNVLYKKLGPEDSFHGKALSEYDYWKYVFGERELYIPRQEYLVKLGDFDPWSLLEGSPALDPEVNLSSGLRPYAITCDELSMLFRKPDNPSSRILEIFNSSKA